MIIASVNARYEIQVEVPLLAVGGSVHIVSSLLDTGFSGYLTLPPAIVSKMGFPWRSDEYFVLANGQVALFRVHVATIEWDGRPRRVAAQVLDSTPLIGMGLLSGFDVKARVLVGGRVELERVP